MSLRSRSSWADEFIPAVCCLLVPVEAIYLPSKEAVPLSVLGVDIGTQNSCIFGHETFPVRWGVAIDLLALNA